MGIDLLREPRCESLSSIRTYQDCPRAYYYKYVEKLKNPIQSSHFRRGSYVDYCLSYALRNNDRLPEVPSDELQQICWSDGTEVCNVDWQECSKIARRVLAFIRGLGWRTLDENPLKYVQTDLMSPDEAIHGIADWLARDPQGNLCLVDFKVSKVQPSPQTCLDFDQQLGIYAYLWNQLAYDEPLHLYQLRIFGRVPAIPKIVKHKNSTKKFPRHKPESGKIITTWEIWSQVARGCGENPESLDYLEQRNYLDNIVWQCFVPVFCPEPVQDELALNLYGWIDKIDRYDARFELRNLRNYVNGPCNSDTSITQRCPFIEPCRADLLQISRPAWAKVVSHDGSNLDIAQ